MARASSWAASSKASPGSAPSPGCSVGAQPGNRAYRLGPARRSLPDRARHANILAKAAHGPADDWLTTTLLATRAPVLFAPAMNTMMYQHPRAQGKHSHPDAGCRFVGPGDGRLPVARLVRPPDHTPAILEAAAITLRNDASLRGRHVLITSGANHEPVDPVRYIGNRSSGKMGHALALEALMRGAEVTVVCGPCDTPPPNGARVLSAPTARAMLEAVDACLPEAAIFIAAAAVADYRVENPPTEKQKRAEGGLTLSLAPNPDIAAHVGVARQPHQIAVGFAAKRTIFWRMRGLRKNTSISLSPTMCAPRIRGSGPTPPRLVSHPGGRGPAPHHEGRVGAPPL